MVNGIIERQDAEENLLKLAAMRNLYSNAEKWIIVEIVVGGLIIGGLYFLLPVFSPNYLSIKPYIGFIAPLSGLIFTIIDIWFINPQINIIKDKAAKIQEDFDTNVLSLSWNDIKIDPVDNEEIILNSKKYKKKEPDFKSLKTWYDEPINEPPISVARIIAQRTNCRWDNTLRESFILGLKLVSLGIFTLLIIITIYESVCSKELVLGVTTLIYGLFSFLYYYIFVIRQIKDNKHSNAKIKRIKLKIENIWKNIEKIDNSELDILSRQIQDEIYDHRKSTLIVFDWFYNLKKEEQQSSSNFSAQKMVDEYFSKIKDN
jgi:hypothetical protein